MSNLRLLSYESLSYQKQKDSPLGEVEQSLYFNPFAFPLNQMICQ